MWEASAGTIRPVTRDHPEERQPVLARSHCSYAVVGISFCKLGREAPLLTLGEEDHHTP